ncbi:ABC transporter permease [Nisaea sp.]|uniref:ABC transporter permease n=1 Tax=Nisaea sp. TaxID=2024842 RepID=UPI0025E7D5B3|nr:ABC transporter permease [Nisaea sp.]
MSGHAEPETGPILASDGTPLKKRLARSLRMQKLRALALIAPLLIFVLVTFIAPIADMLFRSVENEIVSNTLPDTVAAVSDWDPKAQELPSEPVYQALYFDLFLAAEAKEHTKLGTRLNYEQVGISSLFRTSGRKLDDIGKVYEKWLIGLNPAWKSGEFWNELMRGAASAAPDTDLLAEQRARLTALTDDPMQQDIGFVPGSEIARILPLTAREYTANALFIAIDKNRDISKRGPWEAVYTALAVDLGDPEVQRAISGYQGPGSDELRAAAAAIDTAPPRDFTAAMIKVDKDWAKPENIQAIKIYSGKYTAGYYLNAIDMQKTLDGVSERPENQQIYMMLFGRTLFMSLLITFSCILLGYPVAWILANLPLRTSNLLMILVLLPFWTSLLVRTSAWKVMLQQQGVINDTLVWLGLLDDASRLIMINNQFGTIVAMTHILLPFMILPLYSVMQTIPPSYLRAAKSLGATNWTAFWRVYFPQSIPGIGAGSILVFILAIGYYITPEIVGGTTGTFISNRIAFHISSSLNWGLGAALGTILLAAVLALYWTYDKIVGIDNVKLGG